MIREWQSTGCVLRPVLRLVRSWPCFQLGFSRFHVCMHPPWNQEISIAYLFAYGCFKSLTLHLIRSLKLLKFVRTFKWAPYIPASKHLAPTRKSDFASILKIGISLNKSCQTLTAVLATLNGTSAQSISAASIASYFLKFKSPKAVEFVAQIHVQLNKRKLIKIHFDFSSSLLSGSFRALCKQYIVCLLHLAKNKSNQERTDHVWIERISVLINQ